MTNNKIPYVLGELIEDRAKRNGDRIFLRFKDQSYTYQEMDRYANRCANAFLQQGVQKGDKISIMLPNCPEYISDFPPPEFPDFSILSKGCVDN